MTRPNPYAAPALAESDRPPAAADVTRHVSPLEARAIVHLNSAPEHPIEVIWSGLSGREVYRVAGVERLKVRRLALSGLRTFELVTGQGKLVEIRFCYFPLWSASLSYDGQLVVPELFPRMRRFFRTLTFLLAVELAAGGVAVGVWMILARL